MKPTTITLGWMPNYSFPPPRGGGPVEAMFLLLLLQKIGANFRPRAGAAPLKHKGEIPAGMDVLHISAPARGRPR